MSNVSSYCGFFLVLPFWKLHIILPLSAVHGSIIDFARAAHGVLVYVTDTILLKLVFNLITCTPGFNFIFG